MTEKSSIRENVYRLFAEYLDSELLQRDSNFFDLGINSFELTIICLRLSELIDTDLSILVLYEHPTINLLIGFLENQMSAIYE